MRNVQKIIEKLAKGKKCVYQFNAYADFFLICRSVGFRFKAEYQQKYNLCTPSHAVYAADTQKRLNGLLNDCTYRTECFLGKEIHFEIASLCYNIHKKNGGCFDVKLVETAIRALYYSKNQRFDYFEVRIPKSDIKPIVFRDAYGNEAYIMPFSCIEYDMRHI